MDRLPRPAHCPPRPVDAGSLSTPQGDHAAPIPGQRPPAAQRRLEDDVARFKDALRAPTADPGRLYRQIEDSHELLQRATSHCSFHDQELVCQRADALLALARDLARRGLTPDSAEPRPPLAWLRGWQAEMRSLLDMAVEEGARGLVSPPAWNADAFWSGPTPDEGNFVALLRLRRQVLAQLDRACLRNPPHHQGIPELREIRDLLADCDEGDVHHPEGLQKLRSVLAGMQAAHDLVTVGDRLARQSMNLARPQ
ncbi:hypothetical protein ACNI65_03605 [Roseateles sp. So40a]|uniref:hypothetical protein n=1 Tax=Roseateles sp. So40a TaxID=3400226 RepID=UPI003A8C2C71